MKNRGKLNETTLEEHRGQHARATGQLPVLGSRWCIIIYVGKAKNLKTRVLLLP